MYQSDVMVDKFLMHTALFLHEKHIIVRWNRKYESKLVQYFLDDFYLLESIKKNIRNSLVLQGKYGKTCFKSFHRFY